MANYPELAVRVASVNSREHVICFARTVTPYLVDVWLTDYGYDSTNDIVSVQASGFWYLFDIAHSRLISAWGISAGRHSGKRDASRMAGHPLSAGSLYHRGHAIPHTLGGGTDINLVPQLARINIGRFRPLEKLAVATPEAFYFTYWRYPAQNTGQVPSGVDQGLLVVGQAPVITTHIN